jgi:hypothetical protein
VVANNGDNNNNNNNDNTMTMAMRMLMIREMKTSITERVPYAYLYCSEWTIL